MTTNDRAWDMAKQISREKNKVDDWAFVLEVYSQLGGMEKTVYGHRKEISDKSFQIIGMITKTEALIKINDSLVAFDNKEVLKSTKTFKTQDMGAPFRSYELPVTHERQTKRYRAVESIKIRER